jgi:hypothetical protein
VQCVLQGDAVGVRRVRSSLSMRVPTPTQTVHHIVFCSTSTNRSPSTNAMRVAQASVLLAQFGVSFDPFGGAKSRVTVSAYSAPRLAEARQRPARAALGACCHRCVGGAHALDDRFGRRRRLGRAVVRRSAPERRSPARRSGHRCAQATLQDVVDARILDARTLVDPIVALLAANSSCRRCVGSMMSGMPASSVSVCSAPATRASRSEFGRHGAADDGLGLHARRQSGVRRLTRATPPTAEFATSSKKAKNIFRHDKC